MASPHAPLVLPGGRLCLSPTRRPIIADIDGGAACLCPTNPGGGCVPGPSSWCGCSTNPGCISASWYRWLQNITFQNNAITYSDVYKDPVQCCCSGPGSNRSWAYNARRTTRFVNAFNTNAPCVIETGSCSGGGSGTSAISCSGTCRDSFDCVGFPPSDPSGIHTPGCVAGLEPLISPLFCYPSWPGVIAASGYLYRDCSTHELSVTFVSLLYSDTVYVYDTFYQRLDYGPDPDCPPAPACGACCCRGRCYSNMTASACANMGGTHQGPGTSCVNRDCPRDRVVGACCYDNNACDQTSEAACTASGGIYLGDRTVCGAIPCPNQVPGLGACCKINPVSCSYITQAECATFEGSTWYDGFNCAQVQCSPSTDGVCCTTDGICLEITANACAAIGGYFREGPTSCAGVACSGACCSRATTHDPCQCQLTSIQECASILGCAGNPNGTFVGFGSTCSPDPCNEADGGGGGGGGWMPMFDHGARARSRSFGGFRGGCGGCGGGLVLPSPNQVARVGASRAR